MLWLEDYNAIYANKILKLWPMIQSVHVTNDSFIEIGKLSYHKECEKHNFICICKMNIVNLVTLYTVNINQFFGNMQILLKLITYIKSKNFPYNTSTDPTGPSPQAKTWGKTSKDHSLDIELKFLI